MSSGISYVSPISLSGEHIVRFVHVSLSIGCTHHSPAEVHSRDAFAKNRKYIPIYKPGFPSLE